MNRKMTYGHMEIESPLAPVSKDIKRKIEENRDFSSPKRAAYIASNNINLGVLPLHPFNYYKSLKIKELVRQKMGAEQRQMKRCEHQCKIRHF